jgi:hypothetical protein
MFNGQQEMLRAEKDFTDERLFLLSGSPCGYQRISSNAQGSIVTYQKGV